MTVPPVSPRTAPAASAPRPSMTPGPGRPVDRQKYGCVRGKAPIVGSVRARSQHSAGRAPSPGEVLLTWHRFPVQMALAASVHRHVEVLALHVGSRMEGTAGGQVDPAVLARSASPVLQRWAAGPRRARWAAAARPMASTATADGFGDQRSAAMAQPTGASRCGSDARRDAAAADLGDVVAKASSIPGTKAAMS
jgi:hypothetical protein